MSESIPVVTIVSVAPREVWIESDFFGSRHVMVQHEGCDAFCYASFHYDYRYTDNAGTYRQATLLATALGASEPIEHRTRRYDALAAIDAAREGNRDE